MSLRRTFRQHWLDAVGVLIIILAALFLMWLLSSVLMCSAQTVPALMPATDTNNYPSVTLAWDACTNPLVANGGGYNVYFGAISGVYTNKTATTNTTLPIYDLPAGSAYYFAITTFSRLTNSAFSQETAWTNYLRIITNQTFQVWTGTNLLLNVANPTWAQMLFRMSNAWFQASARLNPAAWNNITHFGFTNAAGLRATNIVQFKIIP